MRDHYERCLEKNFGEESVDEGLVRHIGVGYLRGFIDLSEDSFMGKLLQNLRVDPVNQLIRYFWHQKDFLVREESEESVDPDQSKRIIARIFGFWDFIYNSFAGKVLSDDERNIVSETGFFCVFLDDINEDNIDKLRLAASAFGEDIHTSDSFFIEYLDGLKDRGSDKTQVAKYVSELFLMMLSHYAPTYDKDHIRSIVEHLYQLGDEDVKAEANKICNRYVQLRQRFLMDIYRKYN